LGAALLLPCLLPSGASKAGATTTFGDPALYVVPFGDPFLSGVAFLEISTASGTFVCTGSLLASGYHVMTAAHCLTDSAGVVDATFVSARFPTIPGYETVTSNTFFVHPSWTGGLGLADLAIIELSSQAPSGANRYSLYSGSVPNGSDVVLAGYGRSGSGSTGDVLAHGTLRSGQNEIDAAWSGTDTFALDFDNGTAARNTLGGLGLGSSEVMVAPGDSGGPLFLSSMLLGVASFRSCIASGPNCAVPPDIDTALNSSFGERMGYTDLRSYEGWVNGITAPEPATWLLLSAGLGVMALRKRRK
jgi:secreted trypsin-like serine protease